MKKLFIEDVRTENEHGVYGIDISEIGQTMCIASVWLDERSDESIKDSENYAKLFSAAPELLENLIRCVDRLEENGMGDMSAVRRAKEAIKKATS